MQTIGKNFRKIVKEETLKQLKRKDGEIQKGESFSYLGIDNEIVNSLPEEIWCTGEGADGEIREIIEKTIQSYNPDIFY